MCVRVCVCVCLSVCLSAIVSSELHVRSSPIFVLLVTYDHRHRIDKYLDTLIAMKSEDTAIFAPQDGRWKITVSFDGRRFCVPKFRH